MKEMNDLGMSGHHPRMRGDKDVNTYLIRVVRTMAEMEQGLRPVAALDTAASPLAARRIRKLVHGARMSGTGTDGARRRIDPGRVIAAASSHPTIGVTEGVVVLAFEDRTRPYCVRLEQYGDRWRIVELTTPDAGLRPAVTEASRTGSLPSEPTGRRRTPARETGGPAGPTTPDQREPRGRQFPAPAERNEADATDTETGDPDDGGAAAT